LKARSVFFENKGKYINALVWMRPDGSLETYNKRHVFLMGSEDKQVSKGAIELIASGFCRRN